MTFAFRCTDCLALIEVEHPIGQSPPIPSCTCGGDLVRKFFPLPDLWRTSGVYKTDKALYDPEPYE